MTVSGTGCRKHRKVSQVAKRFLAASLVLFQWRREHVTFVLDVRGEASNKGEPLVVAMCSQSCCPLITKLNTETDLKPKGAFCNKTLEFNVLFLFYLPVRSNLF